ncbi:MAG TPA: hypothetical protein VFL76_03670 [Edaphocola sp.]|nr:hypothetical protein [Edaphocola sp.]
MSARSYNPFEPLNFREDTCFLSGELLSESLTVPVFPEWLTLRYQLSDTSIAMLAGNRMKYSEMVLPASQKVAEAIANLDETTEKAFTKGYEAVKALPEQILFQWMARMMYGVVYQDFSYAISKFQEKGREFHISPLMQRKMKNLHLMLQSLIRPIVFDDLCPWSIALFPVNYSKDIFNYKDETHKLNFCLGMNGFGLIACLQDNGAVRRFYQEDLNKIGGQTLHPAQLEELYGRFMYANYLLRESPDYELLEKENVWRLRLPAGASKDDEFAPWDEKVFAQVLANMWQPWGIEMRHIYVPPNSPISLVIDEFANVFIPAEKVNLPN